MSLVRTALRIATVEALRPSSLVGTDGPFPTLAGVYVFDSRIDPLDDVALAERRPIACIYTEEDNGEPIASAGPRFYKRMVDVVAELSVPATYNVGDGELVTAPAITDSELEFKLDMLEAQVRFVLHFGPTGALWRKLAILPAVDVRSIAHRTSEEGVRLAYRSLRLRVNLRNDDEVDPAPLLPFTGLAQFPEPLRSMLTGLPSDHYAVAIANALAPAAPQMPLVRPLKTVTLGGEVTDPATGNIPAAPNLTGELVDLDQGGGEISS